MLFVDGSASYGVPQEGGQLRRGRRESRLSVHLKVSSAIGAISPMTEETSTLLSPVPAFLGAVPHVAKAATADPAANGVTPVNPS